MRTNLAVVASTLVALLAPAAGQAQESASANQVSVGFKLWNASWSSYLPAPIAGVDSKGQPVPGEIFDTAEGERRTNVLPVFSIRHDRWVLSGSYGRYTSNFHAVTSPVVVAPGTNLITTRTDHFVRREADITLGYYVTPELAVSLGYKDADESRDISLGVAPKFAPFLSNKASGVLVGAAGSFPIIGQLRLYTQGAYGPARLKTRFADPSLPNIDVNGQYLIGELGLSHPIFAGNNWLRGANLALGYRTQTVKADSRGTLNNGERKLRDVRDGLVLSLSATL